MEEDNFDLRKCSDLRSQKFLLQDRKSVLLGCLMRNISVGSLMKIMLTVGEMLHHFMSCLVASK